MRGRKRVSILIGPYFNEESLVSCLCHLKKGGVPVSVVGLTSDLLTGLHGLTVRTDFSLSEFIQLVTVENNPHSLIIPGGHEGTAVLFSDPRVHNLILAILKAGNYIAATLPAQQMLNQLGIPSPQETNQFIPQNDLETCAFVDQLIDQLF